MGSWIIQPASHQLVGRQGAVPLGPDATRALLHLAEHAGQVVSREDIARALGGEAGARPHQITQCIRVLRLALDDDSRHPSYIETVPRQGYRLIAPVAAGEEPRGGLDRYLKKERIGDGGMGVVWKAEDTRLKRTVALKFLPEAWSRDPVAKERFLLEAQAAAALDHPNICTLHEIAETPDGQMFFVMAYYDGETVKSRLARGPLPWREAVAIAREVARGLGGAHRHGIVHRDVKPANIMITARGEVKILDFGVAKSAARAGLTRTGTAVGTPTHMSPEQVRGWEVDQRTDLWSLGVVLYEMIAGRLPFRADLEHAVLYSIVHQEPEPLSAGTVDVPPDLDGVVARALAKDPADRYLSAEEMVADLEALLAGHPPIARAPRPPAREATASIAVLPFADLSPERDQEYFCDGMAEELTGALAKVAALRVASRTAAFQFKGRTEDVRAIGGRLGVAAVLAGSVRKAGNRLRVAVELVNVADGYSLWSERFDRELTDVFAVQDEIAGTVAEALRGKLATGEAPRVRPGTEDLQAYQLYLKGRYHWNRRTPESLHKAVATLREALDRDPGFARAHAGLADAYATLGIYGILPPGEAMPVAKAAATQALALDPSLPDALACLGCVRSIFDWRWAEAEQDFRRALDLDARSSAAHHWYALNCLVPRGRFADADAEIRLALDLEPLSLPILASLGVVAYYARRYDDAAEGLRRALDLDPGFSLARFFLGQTLAELGRHDEAAQELRAAESLTAGSAEVRAALGYALARAGRTEEARRILLQLGEAAGRRYVSPSLRAQVHAGLGEADLALRRLEEALEVRAIDLAWLKVRPAFDLLHGREGFTALLERMGLADAPGEKAGTTQKDLPRGE